MHHRHATFRHATFNRLIALYNCAMPDAASFILIVADVAFFLALMASVVFGIVFGYYWLCLGESRSIALISLSVYCIGCILILLCALSTTDIGL